MLVAWTLNVVQAADVFTIRTRICFNTLLGGATAKGRTLVGEAIGATINDLTMLVVGARVRGAWIRIVTAVTAASAIGRDENLTSRTVCGTAAANASIAGFLYELGVASAANEKDDSAMAKI